MGEMRPWRGERRGRDGSPGRSGEAGRGEVKIGRASCRER